MLEELQWEGLEVEALGQVAGSSGIPWGQQQVVLGGICVFIQ